MVRILAFALIPLSICACGIETTVPADQQTSPSTERAVVITSISESATGNTITCEINNALVSPTMSIPIFLEYEGSKIEQTTLTNNQSSHTFSEYNPPTQGNVVCVVEFANAEFESETHTINSQ